MKKIIRNILAALAIVLLGCMFPALTSSAASEPTIPDGVTVEGIALGGMTAQEAKDTLNGYVEQVKGQTLHLTAGEDTVVDIPFSQFGVDISDPGVIDTISQIGSGKNILARYKALRDVTNENAAYTLTFTCDRDALAGVLNEAGGGSKPGTSGRYFSPPRGTASYYR